MLLATVISLISFIIIFIIIAFIAKKMSMFLFLKHYLLTAYLIVIGLTFLLGFVFVKPKIPEYTDGADSPQDLPRLYEWKISEIPDEFVKERWEFSIDSKTIEINTTSPIAMLPVYTEIEVEKEPDRIDMVDVTLYESPATIGIKDISELVARTEVIRKGDNFTLNSVHPYVKGTYYGLENDPITNQFANIKERQGFFERTLTEQRLYLKIPENVEVITNDPDLWINYIK